MRCWGISIRILACVALAVAGCSDDDVQWKMVSKQDIPSPDGKHIATVFELTSGNTTGYFPQLSLRRPGQKLGILGNVLQGELEETIQVEWLSSSNLVVRYPSQSPARPPTNTDGVAITFTLPEKRRQN